MSNGCLREIIRKRRSIRRYKDVPPPEEWIEKILLSVLWAPSPSNLQPVRYIKLESDSIRKELRQHMICGKERLLKQLKESDSSKRTWKWIDVYYHKYCDFLFDAPLIFAVGLIKAKEGFHIKLKEAGLETNYDLASSHSIALGISLSHFILEAQKLGLGTCILTTPMIFMKKLNKILEIQDVDVKCFLTVGFPDESPDPPERLSLSDIYIVKV